MTTETKPLDNIKPIEQPKNYYFTFGFGQGYDNGFFKVENATYAEARKRMVDCFGLKWGFQYDEETFLPQIEKYNLWEVK